MRAASSSMILQSPEILLRIISKKSKERLSERRKKVRKEGRKKERLKTPLKKDLIAFTICFADFQFTKAFTVLLLDSLMFNDFKMYRFSSSDILG